MKVTLEVKSVVAVVTLEREMSKWLWVLQGLLPGEVLPGHSLRENLSGCSYEVSK